MLTSLFKFTQSPETFFVDEELPYPLTGEGSFLFAKFEKSDMSTQQLVRRVSEISGVPLKHIRHAGLKDRLSTSRQWLCWEKKFQKQPFTQNTGLKILEETLHSQVLRTGQVARNFFKITVECDPGMEDRINAAFPEKFPNFFGPQRFANCNAEQLAWPNRKDRFLISQYQSGLFNLYLASRLKTAGFDNYPKDLFTRTNGRRVFEVDKLDELESELTLANSPAIPTGPIPGYKFPHSSHPLEQEFLKTNCPDLEKFRQFGKIAMGARRPLWVFPELEEIRSDGPQIQLSFWLPSGSYATVLLLFMLDSEFYLNPVKEWARFDS